MRMQHQGELSGDLITGGMCGVQGRTATANGSRLVSISPSRRWCRARRKSSVAIAATSAASSSGHGTPARDRSIWASMIDPPHFSSSA